MIERRGRSLRVGVGRTFDCDRRNGSHWFEEAKDNVLALGERRVAEFSKMSRQSG